MQVKWIFVRDIPNNALRHLKLSCVTPVRVDDARSNTPENKPVTSSRDTQEIPTDIGREMLRIFSTFPSKTSLLHDFAYYESLSQGDGSQPAEVIVKSEPAKRR